MKCCLAVALIASTMFYTGRVTAQTVHYDGPHGVAISINVVTAEKKRAIGFNVYTGRKLEAAVRFTSRGLISCRNPRVKRSNQGITISFARLSASPNAGFELKNSRLDISARRGHYPKVDFWLHVLNFDKVTWQNRVGKQPFHFLKIEMPNAQVWQQGGWLNATPLADMFPLLLDVHIGTPEISGYHYNREWSNTTPISALPIPVIGLWNPSTGHYAAWDFMENRLTSNSERNIAVGYCNRLILPESQTEVLPQSETLPPITPTDWKTQSTSTQVDQHNSSRFIAMVFPYGGIGYQHCVYPGINFTLQASARLVFTSSLPSTTDPNSFLWSTYWHDPTIHDRLPRAPRAADLGFVGNSSHLATIPNAPVGSILGGIGVFGVRGTTAIGGWGRQDEGAVAVAVANKDTAALVAMRKEANDLAASAVHFKSGGLNCVYWKQPLTGQWVTKWGGKPAGTLHNSAGFTAARLLLDLAYYDHDTQYLPVVDGVMNWAKGIVWTRGEFPDVPSSPFAIGGTTAVSFLLDYYSLYHNDGQRRDNALQALKLARSFAYRYMVMWAGDGSRTDRLDSAFLWEPNSGRDWTGAACSNEVIWDLDMVAETAVYTGDPVLRWALNGTLSRWHRLYQNVYRPNIEDYSSADFAEGYGLAPGNIYGYPGGRAAYGFGGPLKLLDPVGSSIARVIAGPRAALVFDRNVHTVILSAYRWTSAGQFAFKLQGIPGTADVTVTAPFANIGNEPVALENGVYRKAPLVTRNCDSQWTIVIRGVKTNEWVVVGSPNIAESTPEPFAVSLTEHTSPTPPEACAPFVPLVLTHDTRLKTEWQNSSFAGLTAGLRWIWSVPFIISNGIGATESHTMLPDPTTENLRACFILYAPATTKSVPEPLMSNGMPSKPFWPSPALAWRGWPSCISSQLREIGYLLPNHAQLVGIKPNGTKIVAASGLTRVSPNTRDQITARLRSGAKELAAIDHYNEQIELLRIEASSIPPDKIALFEPVQQNNPAYTLLTQGLLLTKSDTLSPQQICSPKIFNAKRYPVAIYLDGEDYDVGDETPASILKAIRTYLRAGGTLVLMAHLPFPFYYPVDGSGTELPGDPLLPKLGLPLYNAIEAAPANQPTIQLFQNETVLTGLPPAFDYPQGDPRLRSINSAQVPTGSKYQPIYEVKGARGTNYGDAAGLLTLAAQPGRPPGRILYISAKIIDDPVHGTQVICSAVKWIAHVVQRINR